jgi:cystathionine gamma-synthase
MKLKVQVISQQPPGGRCSLYTRYADVLARHFAVTSDVAFSETRDAHGEGFPSLWLNGAAIEPEDSFLVTPADITAALTALGVPGETMAGLAEALQAPLEAMLNDAG